MFASKKNPRHKGFESDQDFIDYHSEVASNPDHPNFEKSVQVLNTRKLLEQAKLTRKAMGRSGKAVNP